MTLASQGEWDDLARSKLTKIFGASEAEQLMERTLNVVGLQRLSNANELHRFASELSTQGGFASAAGALLSLTAVLRGATAEKRDS